jgi:hypothetical protein
MPNRRSRQSSRSAVPSVGKKGAANHMVLVSGFFVDWEGAGPRFWGWSPALRRTRVMTKAFI